MSAPDFRHSTALRPPPGPAPGGRIFWNFVQPDKCEITDVSLLQRMARGDRDAFALFYDRHAGSLFGLALRMMGDPGEAEDVLQDALLQLWERSDRFDERLGRPLSWAFTLVRNRAIDRLRSLNRDSRLFEATSADPETAGSGTTASAADHLELMDDAVRVRSALNQLPVDQRTAIELAFFGGLSQVEIAGKLDQPLGTIKARIRRGMLKLREVLETALPAAGKEL